MTRALSFLVNDAKLKHNNLHTASVFVNEAGDWKLSGLEYVTGVDQEPPLKILPGLEKYEPPERSKVPVQYSKIAKIKQILEDNGRRGLMMRISETSPLLVACYFLFSFRNSFILNTSTVRGRYWYRVFFLPRLL